MYVCGYGGGYTSTPKPLYEYAVYELTPSHELKPMPTSDYAPYGYATNVYELKPTPMYEYAPFGSTNAYESKSMYGFANSANLKGRTSSFLGSRACTFFFLVLKRQSHPNSMPTCPLYLS
jgi:hypothetical protein